MAVSVLLRAPAAAVVVGQVDVKNGVGVGLLCDEFDARIANEGFANLGADDWLCLWREAMIGRGFDVDRLERDLRGRAELIVGASTKKSPARRSRLGR